MSKGTGPTTNQESESLVATFHQAKSLIPKDQNLKTIPPEMPVSEALAILRQNRFSQLPVVAGNAVLGVFSYRSFSDKALTTGGSLGDLPVEEFLESFEKKVLALTIESNPFIYHVNYDFFIFSIMFQVDCNCCIFRGKLDCIAQ